MDHETISYKALIPRALSTIYNRLTLSYKNWFTHAPIYCFLIACLHYAIPNGQEPLNDFSIWPALTAQSS